MRRTFILTAILASLLLPLSAQTLTLTSPNGGENWTIGGTAMITWTSGNVVTVRLVLYRGGTATANRIGIIAQGLPAASGGYAWTVGSYIGGTAAAGSDYLIRVKSEGDTTDDFSNSAFTLSGAPPPQPSLTLVSPNGGESWEKGSDHAISWTAANMTTSYRLLLLKDGQVLGTIKDSLSGNGAASLPWKAGDYLGGSATVMGGGYKIRIESTGGQGQYGDASDNSFMITAAPITIAPLAKIELQRLLPARPDLVACLKWDGGVPLIYQDKRIYVRVKNIGQGDAPASMLKVYVKQNGDHFISVPALAPGAEFEWSKKFDWPTCGHKTVRATADCYGQVTESSENNNVLEAKVEVSCGMTSYQLEVDRCSDQK